MFHSSTVDSLITHTLRWTTPGMGFQGVWTPRRGQTKAKQIKYYLKIRKKDQKQIHYVVAITMRVESLSRRLNIIFFFLLPLINDGIQSSRKFSWSCMPQFCYFWSPFVYKAISHHFSSSFGQFSCEFYPKLSEIKPQYLWVFCLLRGMGYGLLRLYGL